MTDEPQNSYDQSVQAVLERSKADDEAKVPRSEQAATEVFYSMNFFDEQAVFKAFGTDIMEFAPDPVTKKGGRPMMFLRALALVHLRRTAPDHATAWEEASNLTFEDLESYFPDEEPELDEDDPETDQGKEPSPSG